MEIKEELMKLFIVKDIDGKEVLFLNEKEALEFEKKTLEEKTRKKIEIFCNSAFSGYNSGNGVFDIEDIKERLFDFRDLLKRLELCKK